MAKFTSNVDLVPKQMMIQRTGELLGFQEDLGRACEMNNVRIYREILKPGARSSSPHRHTKKEEFVYILRGSPTAILGEERRKLAPGEGVAFLPSDMHPHVIVNDSLLDAEMLIISDDPSGDEVVYDLTNKPGP